MVQAVNREQLEALRRACAQAVCQNCRRMPEWLNRPEYQDDPEPAYWHEADLCRASNIWLLELDTFARAAPPSGNEFRPSDEALALRGTRILGE